MSPRPEVTAFLAAAADPSDHRLNGRRDAHMTQQGHNVQAVVKIKLGAIFCNTCYSASSSNYSA
jgi:hypothetical protein